MTLFQAALSMGICRCLVHSASSYGLGVTCDTWHLTHDIWHVTSDMWQVVGGRTYSKNFRSLDLLIWENDVLKVFRNIGDADIMSLFVHFLALFGTFLHFFTFFAPFWHLLTNLTLFEKTWFLVILVYLLGSLAGIPCPFQCVIWCRHLIEARAIL